LGEPLSKQTAQQSAIDYDNSHFRNFLSVMRSRKVEDLYADVEEGHLSCCHVHLANISYRLGKDTPLQPRQAPFAGDPEATDAFQRMQAHLQDNHLLMQASTYRLGRLLHFDAEDETLNGDPEANALRTRAYREPFVVPEKVK
jgi:hypothetical protein